MMTIDAQAVWAALKEVIDPEIGINIVDLGLVYDIHVDPSGHLEVVMTLTTPACPLSSYFERLIPHVVTEKVPEVGSVGIRFVWDPVWNPQMMSDEAKKSLGWA